MTIVEIDRLDTQSLQTLLTSLFHILGVIPDAPRSNSWPDVGKFCCQKDLQIEETDQDNIQQARINLISAIGWGGS